MCCSLGFAKGAINARFLDALSETGVISKMDADAVKKESSSIELLLPQAEPQLRTFLILQNRYTYAQHTYCNAANSSQSRFDIRRLIPVFIANPTENTSVFVAVYLPSDMPINSAFATFNFESEYVCGTFKAGFLGPNFSMEEPDSCTNLYTPDRNILCLYFGGGDGGIDGYRKTAYGTSLGFSGSHPGIYFDGYLPTHKEYVYQLGFSNSKNDALTIRRDNGVIVWLMLGYEKKFEDFSVKFGSNFGYSTKSVSAIAGGASLPSEIVDCGDLYGIDPYFRLATEKFTLQLEYMMAKVQYGKTKSDLIPTYTTSSGYADPHGFSVMVAYKLFDLGKLGKLEPIFRYTYLNTDGKGVRECDVAYKSPNAGGLFNKAHAYYAGINWYIRGRYLKYAMGIEHLDFQDSPMGLDKGSASSDIVIGQLQVMF